MAIRKKEVKAIKTTTTSVRKTKADVKKLKLLVTVVDRS